MKSITLFYYDIFQHVKKDSDVGKGVRRDDWETKCGTRKMLA